MLAAASNYDHSGLHAVERLLSERGEWTVDTCDASLSGGFTCDTWSARQRRQHSDMLAMQGCNRKKRARPRWCRERAALGLLTRECRHDAGITSCTVCVCAACLCAPLNPEQHVQLWLTALIRLQQLLHVSSCYNMCLLLSHAHAGARDPRSMS